MATTELYTRGRSSRTQSPRWQHRLQGSYFSRIFLRLLSPLFTPKVWKPQENSSDILVAIRCVFLCSREFLQILAMLKACAVYFHPVMMLFWGGCVESFKLKWLLLSFRLGHVCVWCYCENYSLSTTKDCLIENIIIIIILDGITHSQRSNIKRWKLYSRFHFLIIYCSYVEIKIAFLKKYPCTSGPC